MKYLLSILCLFIFSCDSGGGDEVQGCTDIDACNFNADATIDNGSCYSSSQGYTFYDYNFIKDKYFFINPIFKSNFYPLSENNTFVPTFNSNYVIKDLILFKNIPSTNIEIGSQSGAAYYSFEQAGDDFLDDDNREYELWLQLVENVDYILNKELGYIRLLIPAYSDMIAAHYTTGNLNQEEQDYMGTHIEFDTCIDTNGNIIDDVNCYGALEGSDNFIENNFIAGFQSPDICLISECISDTDSFLVEGEHYINYNGIEGYQGSDIRLKLIKGNHETTSYSPAWDLMWKNVYSLGLQNIDLNTLNVEIVYAAGVLGNETVSPGGNTYLNIFGLDNRSQNGLLIEGGDGQIDLNGWFINLQFGELIMPFHMPFAYDENYFTIQYDGTPYDAIERYWGNPHPDLESVFAIDLSGMSQDESIYYENYTIGPSMYYESTQQSNLNFEHKFNIYIESSTCP